MDPNYSVLKDRNKFASSSVASLVLPTVSIYLCFSREGCEVSLKTGLHEVAFCCGISRFVLTNPAFFCFKGHCYLYNLNSGAPLPFL